MQLQTQVEQRVLRIREYFQKQNFNKACIGISGGKDSAVAAALVTRALGPQNVIAAIVPNGLMPDMYDAKQICKALQLSPVYVSISAITSILMNEVPKACKHPFDDTVREAQLNAVARSRMTVLRYIAAINHALLIGTANKSEWYVGYFTKGGDDSADFAPIIDLTCTQVIQLGKLMPEIPKYILDKPPADGLSGRTDEKRLGVSYEQIDAHIAGTLKDETAKQHIENLHNQTRHKRVPIATIFDV